SLEPRSQDHSPAKHLRDVRPIRRLVILVDPGSRPLGVPLPQVLQFLKIHELGVDALAFRLDRDMQGRVTRRYESRPHHLYSERIFFDTSEQDSMAEPL